jgi:hypothetical protein
LNGRSVSLTLKILLSINTLFYKIMKIKYLIGAAAISAAVLCGSMAFAQTPAPSPTNDNSNAADVTVPAVPSANTAGQNNGAQAAQAGLGRGNMMGRFGGNNIGGQRTMNAYPSNAGRTMNRAPRANAASIVALIFVATITVLLAWAFMVLGIMALIRHLKDKK